MISDLKRRAIGAAMRAYRASPLYPQLGKALGGLLGAVTPQKTVTATIDGVRFELDLREVIDASLYYSGTFEKTAERTIASAVKPGMVAVDIGANIGYHTFRMAKGVGPGGLVVAIEPMTQAFARLSRNIAANDFGNIRGVQIALSDRDEGGARVKFQSSYQLDGKQTQAEETVQLCTLDTAMNSLGIARVDFIKLDVDGFEGKVFRGAAQTIAKHRPAIFFEITPKAMLKNGDAPGELIGLLKSHGYTILAENLAPIDNLSAVLARAGDNSVNLFARP